MLISASLERKVLNLVLEDYSISPVSLAYLARMLPIIFQFILSSFFSYCQDN